ncbi:CaiB/BaiF CoA-transferase family protein [Geodermatophilus sp. DSM 45219]|uniref:CaiB/BaiF CoA transferase family protein n=1 Tax=Geodermatophilus sp. DSM 45219 TaxID=1881103 RepID=UPI00088CC017|nr:CoA transferase [Geodermatophilus sp. DSM 45219]SDN80607.1 succinyl-CoA:(R)-citramalate CoA-transferase [Geodermatophilus sp. DSM 45219]
MAEPALSGVRVLELGQVIAGPFCGQLLGDLGADVVKVEPPGVGDVLRQWGRVHGEDGDSLWWRVTGRNKRSVTVDLRRPEGQDIVRRLAGHCDVVLENFRPGTLERWGLGWADLSRVDERLVMVRVSGFGQDGPYAGRAGYAAIGEAMGGLRALTGYPDRPPTRVGLSIGDSLAGTMAALGAVAALEARHRTGRGQVVDASIFESVLAMTEALVPEWQVAELRRERTGPTLPGIAPSNVYPTADGQVLVAANQDSVFRRLAAAMDAPELAEDPRFADHRARGERQAELDGIIAAWTRPRSAAEVLDRLHGAGVPAGLVYEPADMLEDPHFRARDSIVHVPDEEFGEVAMPAVVPRLSATPGSVRERAPRLGEHTDAVLAELLGLGAEEVAALRAAGVV